MISIDKVNIASNVYNWLITNNYRKNKDFIFMIDEVTFSVKYEFTDPLLETFVILKFL